MKLIKGDEVRIIAPSKSMSVLTRDQIETAKLKLENMGLKVTYGKHVNESDDYYGCASIQARIEDIHEAFLDKNVKCIIAARGGYNANQLLQYIDYDLIKNNPKILCGFSDITCLLNAIYKKTGIETYCGPIYSNFGMKLGFEYTQEYFEKLLFDDKEVLIESSKEFSDDAWYKDQNKRIFIPNDGMQVINKGNCSGTIIGGNLYTLNLLQGTDYMPSLKDSVLFLEDDNISGKNFLLYFDREIESLMKLPDFKDVKGIVFGRSQNNCEMDKNKWRVLLKSKPRLDKIPIIINADFGHTTPIFTFPIGGKCMIEAKNDSLIIKIQKRENY